MFTPLQGVGKLEKALLEKARAIVACVRYGQHYSGVSKILFPLLILERLRDRKVIGPHSEIGRSMCFCKNWGSENCTCAGFQSRYNFHLLDTEENLRALEMAIQYLVVQEVVKGNPKEAEARTAIVAGCLWFATQDPYGIAAHQRDKTQPIQHKQTEPSDYRRVKWHRLTKTYH